jgi:ribonuclease D
MTQKSSKTRPTGSPWPRYRSKHRELSHDQAHAEPHDASATPVLQHALVCAHSPELVVDQKSLHDAIDRLRAGGSFGYDSEFIGEHSYYPELCLMQVASLVFTALIDPLAPLDLTPFWELLADPAVEKIVHAGQPDLEPVARHLRQPPRNVFDTQIAAGFAGLPYPMALGKLLTELTGGSLAGSTRGMKFSRWNKRPLSAAQIRYAADDVRYLPLLRHLIGERLRSNGNTAYAAEECQSLTAMELYEFDAQSQRVRIRGVDKLGPGKAAALRALIAWRDNAAREQNVPPRSLVRDEVLYAMAAAPVRSQSDLKEISGLPRPVKQHYSADIVDAVNSAIESAAAADPSDREGQRRRVNSDDLRDHVESLWHSIVQRCQARAIDPKLAASKRELERVLRARHRGVTVDSPLLKGWRREVIGSLDLSPRH